MLPSPSHVFSQASAITLMAALVAACGAPLGPIPGGALDGVLSPWPNDWQHAEDCENVLLQTNPDEPYSVTIWGVGMDQAFYVGASKRTHQWAVYMEEDPRVTLEVDGKLYLALAERVTDPAKNQLIADRFIAKYDMDPDNLDDDGAFYQLVKAP